MELLEGQRVEEHFIKIKCKVHGKKRKRRLVLDGHVWKDHDRLCVHGVGLGLGCRDCRDYFKEWDRENVTNLTPVEVVEKLGKISRFKDMTRAELRVLQEFEEQHAAECKARFKKGVRQWDTDSVLKVLGKVRERGRRLL